MNGSYEKSEISETWVLFESGHSRLVSISLNPLSMAGGRPIDGYFVIGGEAGGFTIAARRAAQAVYESAKQRFQRSYQRPVSVAYDLEHASCAETFFGESAGLAFAVALAKRVYEKDPGPVAATGAVSGGEKGSVERVEGIAAKLQAALDVLPEGGWVFCPKANEQEITDTLRKRIEDNGIRIRFVSRVSEMLDILFPQDKPVAEALALRLPEDKPERSKKKFYIGALLLMACVGAAATVWINSRNPSADNEPVSTPVVNTIPGETPAAAATPLPPAEKPMPVTFTGDTLFTSRAAEQLIDPVKAFLKEAYPDSSPAVSGAVTMVRIIEETDPVTGRLHADVELALKDLVFEKEGTRKSFEIIAVRIKGEGPAGGLLAAAVGRLAEEVKTRLSGRPHAGGTPAAETKPDGGRGFD